jgi:DNA-binding response OmpR family regulator
MDHDNNPKSDRPILIVDDEPEIREMIGSYLKKEGFEVVGAKDVMEGKKALKQHEPDVILLDWNMPHGEGIDLVRDLRRDPEYNDRYIIMVTARSESEELLEGLDAGADEYITKPFQVSDLLARVRVGVRTRKLQRKLAQQVKMNTVLQMAGAIAHEIGNPLTAIRLIHHNILQKPALSTDPSLAEDLKNLAIALDRIETLVREAQNVTSLHSVPYAGDLRITNLRDTTE